MAQRSPSARPRDLRDELHVVDEGGAWASGGEAKPWVLERVRAREPLERLLRLPRSRKTIEPGYRRFAASRARFGSTAGSFRNRSFGSA